MQAVSFKRWPIRLYFTLKVNASIAAQCCRCNTFSPNNKNHRRVECTALQSIITRKSCVLQGERRANHIWLAVWGWNPQVLWCQVMQSKLVALFPSPLVMNFYHVLCPPDCSFLIGSVLGTATMGFIVPILSTTKCFCSPSTENHWRHLKILID